MFYGFFYQKKNIKDVIWSAKRFDVSERERERERERRRRIIIISLKSLNQTLLFEWYVGGYLIIEDFFFVPFQILCVCVC